MSPVRVLVVEDDPMLLAFVEEAMEHEPGMEVAAVFASDPQWTETVTQQRPDVVLMDVERLGEAGRERMRELASQEHAAPVVAITGDRDEAIVAAFRAGAKGLLVKSTARRDLVEALRVVAAGGVWADARAQALLVEQLASPQRRQAEQESTVPRFPFPTGLPAPCAAGRAALTVYCVPGGKV